MKRDARNEEERRRVSALQTAATAAPVPAALPPAAPVPVALPLPPPPAYAPVDPRIAAAVTQRPTLAQPPTAVFYLDANGRPAGRAG